MPKSSPERAVPRLAFSINEAAQSIGRAPRAIAEAIREGRLKAKSDGLRVLIPAGELQRYVDALPDITAPLRASPNPKVRKPRNADTERGDQS